jgi:hypothetical protein
MMDKVQGSASPLRELAVILIIRRRRAAAQLGR